MKFCARSIGWPGCSIAFGRTLDFELCAADNDRWPSDAEGFMLFMIIENFRDQDAKSVYHRFAERGRLMPEGLTFVDSWVQADLSRCFQVVECGDVTVLQRWVAEWRDLVEFEIVPIVGGKETAEALVP